MGPVRKESLHENSVARYSRNKASYSGVIKKSKCQPLHMEEYVPAQVGSYTFRHTAYELCPEMDGKAADEKEDYKGSDRINKKPRIFCGERLIYNFSD